MLPKRNYQKKCHRRTGDGLLPSQTNVPVRP